MDLGIATTAEGAQEALAASLQNMIEQGYNPEQVISEGVTEAGLYGGGVGGAVEAIIQFVEGRKRRRAEMIQRLTTQEMEKALQLIHKANKQKKDLPIPKELQMIHPLEWVLLEQLLELILEEKNQKTLH